MEEKLYYKYGVISPVLFILGFYVLILTYDLNSWNACWKIFYERVLHSSIDVLLDNISKNDAARMMQEKSWI